MLKIGTFSKLSHLTVKTLRFYEKEGLLLPAEVDTWTGYRFYTSEQLQTAARIKAYRKMGLSIEEIRSVFAGKDVRAVLLGKRADLQAQRAQIDGCLSLLTKTLEEKMMEYTVTEKTVPQAVVYSAETVLASYKDMMEWIPSIGAECLALNPTLTCAEPPYEFCEYLDHSYKETDIHIRHSEAVNAMGQGNEHIYFRVVPQTKVLSVFHKGPYDTIGEAYAFLAQYAEDNDYRTAGPARECYIDGIWNCESEADWLTEVQLPIL